MAFQGTVDRVDGELAHVTFSEPDGRTYHATLPYFLFRERGIGEGDDFTGEIRQTRGGAAVPWFTLLPRRELTPAEVDAIRRKAEELRDE